MIFSCLLHSNDLILMIFVQCSLGTPARAVGSSTHSDKVFLHALEPMSEIDHWREVDLEGIVQQFSELEIEEEKSEICTAIGYIRSLLELNPIAAIPQVRWFAKEECTIIEGYLDPKSEHLSDHECLQWPSKYVLCVHIHPSMLGCFNIASFADLGAQHFGCCWQISL